MGAKNHAVIMSDGNLPFECRSIRCLFLIVLANKNLALNSVVGAAFGGEYFLAQAFEVLCLSSTSCWPTLHGNFSRYVICIRPHIEFYIVSNIAILVGKAQTWLPDLVERVSKLKVNGGFEQDTDMLVFIYLPKSTESIACRL
jgi:hypothetical protein